MAVPCPTSMISAWKVSGATLARTGNSSGSHSRPPIIRSGNPRGNNSQTVPATASSTVHSCGAGWAATAHGSALAQTSPFPNPAISHAAACHSGGTITPSSANGVTSQLTSGMAMALASGETSDACWNSKSKAGASASVTAACTVTQPRSLSGSARRPNVVHRIAAMAPNDSQKPADNTAHGSISNTANKAHTRAEKGRGSRRPQNASASTPSMNRVRCAGT